MHEIPVRSLRLCLAPPDLKRLSCSVFLFVAFAASAGADGEGGTGRRESDKPSHWWVAGLVIAVLALAVVGLLVYLKMKGEHRPTHFTLLQFREKHENIQTLNTQKPFGFEVNNVSLLSSPGNTEGKPRADPEEATELNTVRGWCLLEM